jgi:hypothetical protein
MLDVSTVYQDVYMTSMRYQNEQQNCTEKCIMLYRMEARYQDFYMTCIRKQNEQQNCTEKCIMLYGSTVYQNVYTTSIMY